jgi:ribonuclease J
VHDDVDQFIGKGAQEVNICKYSVLAKHDSKYEHDLRVAQNMKTYEATHRYDVGGKGEIFITPFFVDHSAFDSYMFLIEADNKRILHTGDFRGHGYLSKGLEKILKLKTPNIDVLITEGTMLSRQDKKKAVHEITIKAKAKKLLEQGNHPHFLFALCSSTDMDRLASFHAACKKTKAKFLCDSYQKSVLDIFTKYAAPHGKLFDFDDETTLVLGENCDFERDLRPNGFIMPVRAGSQLDFVKKMLYYFPDAELIYSMWKGYYEGTEEQKSQNVIDFLNLFHGHFHYLHTSGHADVETLEKVCRITNPSIGVIPIHRDKNTQFEALSIPQTVNVITKSVTIGDTTIIIK